ncbi:hypothetical protein CRYUN_Cryun30bG0015800 [Craigia yunnanensis]
MKNFSFYTQIFDAGHLTRLRSDNTDNEKLAQAAVKNGLHQFIRNRTPIHDEQVSNNPGKIQVFMEELEEYHTHSHGLVNVPKVLADIFESTIGAVYIDSNCSLEIVWKVFRSVLEPIIYLEMLGEHPGAKLQDSCRKNKLELRYVKESWKKDATVSISIENKLVGKATYHLKKDIAVNRAAKIILDKIDSVMIDLGIDYNSSIEKDEEKHEEDENDAPNKWEY